MLGTTKTMETGTNRRFFTRFLSALVKDGDSNSIAAALQDAADANDYEYYDENNNLVSALNGFPYYAVGDKSQYLN